MQFRKLLESKLQKLQEHFFSVKSICDQMEQYGVNTECRGTGSTKVIPPDADRKVTSWSTIRRKFEAAAISNMWNDKENATSLIAAVRSEASDILTN